METDRTEASLPYGDDGGGGGRGRGVLARLIPILPSSHEVTTDATMASTGSHSAGTARAASPRCGPLTVHSDIVTDSQ